MISQCVSGNEVTKICENYYKKRSIDCSGFLVKSFELRAASSETLGFFAQHLVLNVRTERDELTDNLTFFVKALPKSLPEHAEFVTSFHAFEKEIDLYESFIPEAHSLVSRKWAPDCFFTRKDDLIVLEHLILSGYRMAETNALMLDMDHLLLSLKTIAALHASSIIFQSRQPERMREIAESSLHENTFPDPKKGGLRSKSVELGIMGVLCLFKEIYSDQQNDLLPKFEQEIRSIFELTQPSKKYQNVVSHSDLWSNNIMFRYEEDGRTPRDAILVDFQLARWAPPAYEALVFIYLNTNSEFRARHLPRLLESYYSYLEDELSHHKIDVNAVLSRKDFDECCNLYTIPALITVLIFGPFIFLPSDSSKDLLSNADTFHQMIFVSRNEIILKYFGEDRIYRERMMDAITAFVQLIQ